MASAYENNWWILLYGVGYFSVGGIAVVLVSLSDNTWEPTPTSAVNLVIFWPLMPFVAGMWTLQEAYNEAEKKRLAAEE